MDQSDKSDFTGNLDTGTFNEVQLVLAEKRTALSTLRRASPFSPCRFRY
jgi:hypothetical protein